MTTEMGPRDVTLGWTERFAGRLAGAVCQLISSGAEDKSVRYNNETATVTFSGESEYAGDAFNRGKFLAYVFLISNISTVMLLALVGSISPAGTFVADTLLLSVLAVTSAIVLANAVGSANLIAKIDVIDHTTEPLPDALTELQESYVNGDIGEADLERQVGEVMQRE